MRITNLESAGEGDAFDVELRPGHWWRLASLVGFAFTMVAFVRPSEKTFVITFGIVFGLACIGMWIKERSEWGGVKISVTGSAIGTEHRRKRHGSDLTAPLTDTDRLQVVQQVKDVPQSGAPQTLVRYRVNYGEHVIVEGVEFKRNANLIAARLERAIHVATHP